MKHLLKIAICMGLTAVLLLSTACGGNNGSNGNSMAEAATTGTDGNRAAATATAATGRYVEVDVTPPIDGWFMSLIAQDGTLAAFDEGLRTRYDSTNMGETWTPSPGPGSGTDRFEGVRTAAFLPDGRLLAYVQYEGMTKISPDGATEHFPVDEIDSAVADGDTHNITLIQALDNGQIMLTYSIDWIARFMREHDMGDFVGRFGNDEDGDDIEDLDMGTVEDAYNEMYEYEDATEGMETGGRGTVRTSEVRVSGTAGVGGDFRFGDMETTAIHDLATGQQISTREVPTPVGANSHGDIYTMQGHSLLRYGANGYVDTVLDGTAFAFGASNNSVASVQLLADGGLVVNVLVDWQFNRLFKYVWDANATVDPNKTITIWSLEDNALVRAAITEIWRLHPDADITYEIALLGDTAISASDAIRTLNTRLLSGRGPDILILDGAPIDSYAGRGMLLDLTGRVDTGGIYQNLLAPYLDGGQMHVIPTQFSIPMLMGSAHTLAEVPTLAALVESIVTGNPAAAMDQGRMLGGIPEDERAQMGFNDLEELFDLMWQANASAFINDNRLDSDALREFLAAIEAISNMYELTAADDITGGMGVFMAVGGGGGRANMVSGSLMQYMMQSTNLAAFSVDNIMLLQMMMARDDSELAIFPGLTPGAWLPSTIVGVSADTSVEDFAIAFVNTMISLQVQQINHGEGLPVTRQGIQAQIAQINQQLAEFDMDPFDVDMDTFVNQLQTPALIEATLREMIWGTVERLCTGRVDLEGAVQEVEQNIRNYLAERS